MATFLERYRDGEHEAVWSGLVALGPRVREDPIFGDALATARETMLRVRENIERIVTRLDAIGYKFHAARALAYHQPPGINPFTKQPIVPVPAPARKPMVFRPPGSDVGEEIAEIEQIAGVLPLSLRAWFEIMGEVDLTGSHPDWPGEQDRPPVYSDPLVMTSAEEWLRENRRRGSGRNGTQRPFSVSLPDYYLKGRISGGHYWIELPDPTADAPLKGPWHSRNDESMGGPTATPHENTFVQYLRTCFLWGGFPGFALSAKRPERELALLVNGLLPV